MSKIYTLSAMRDWVLMCAAESGKMNCSQGHVFDRHYQLNRIIILQRAITHYKSFVKMFG